LLTLRYHNDDEISPSGPRTPRFRPLF